MRFFFPVFESLVSFQLLLQFRVIIMDPKFRFGQYKRPRRRKQQEHPVDIEVLNFQSELEEHSSNFESDVEIEQKWEYPDQSQLTQELANPNNHICESAKEAWKGLIETGKCKGNVDWSPGKTIVEFLLVVLVADVSNGITREILKLIIVLLQTLQNHGVIVDMELPKSASVIESMVADFPKPRISYVEEWSR